MEGILNEWIMNWKGCGNKPTCPNVMYSLQLPGENEKNPEKPELA